MSFPFQILQIQGRLVFDPELKTTPSGKAVAQFVLAYNGRHKTDAQGSYTSFLQVEAWEKQAEFVAKNLRKGMQVMVRGDLVQKRWQDKNGKKKSELRLISRGVVLTGVKKNQSNNSEVSSVA